MTIMTMINIAAAPLNAARGIDLCLQTDFNEQTLAFCESTPVQVNLYSLK